MKKIRIAALAGMLGMATLVVVPTPSVSQTTGRAVATASAWPDADPEDVASIDASLTARYVVISGPAGETRDWDRLDKTGRRGRQLLDVVRRLVADPIVFLEVQRHAGPCPIRFGGEADAASQTLEPATGHGGDG